MNKIVEIKFGSHLYGTDTPESDLDLKGIYIPTGREIILHSFQPTVSVHRAKAEKERNTKDDVDLEIFSLDRYLGLLMEGQTVALDMLFAPDAALISKNDPGAIFTTIFNNRERLITRNIVAFVGYARQQAAKYGIKGSRMDALKRTVAFLEPLPLWDRLAVHADAIASLVSECAGFITLEKTPLVDVLHLPASRNSDALAPYLHVCGRKVPFTATVKLARECFEKILEQYGARATKAHLDGGIDWKALSHAVRVNSEAKELLLTSVITFPLPNRDFILKIKTGQLPYDLVAETIEQGLAELYDAHDKSKLPDAPDRQWADDFVYDVYSQEVKP